MKFNNISLRVFPKLLYITLKLYSNIVVFADIESITNSSSDTLRAAAIR